MRTESGAPTRVSRLGRLHAIFASICRLDSGREEAGRRSSRMETSVARVLSGDGGRSMRHDTCGAGSSASEGVIDALAVIISAPADQELPRHRRLHGSSIPRPRSRERQRRFRYATSAVIRSGLEVSLAERGDAAQARLHPWPRAASAATAHLRADFHRPSTDPKFATEPTKVTLVNRSKKYTTALADFGGILWAVSSPAS